jgi:hypothetical protein
MGEGRGGGATPTVGIRKFNLRKSELKKEAVVDFFSIPPL